MVVGVELLHNELRRAQVETSGGQGTEQSDIPLQATRNGVKLVIDMLKCLSTEEFPERDQVEDPNVTFVPHSFRRILCSSDSSRWKSSRRSLQLRKAYG